MNSKRPLVMVSFRRAMVYRVNLFRVVFCLLIGLSGLESPAQTPGTAPCPAGMLERLKFDRPAWKASLEKSADTGLVLTSTPVKCTDAFAYLVNAVLHTLQQRGVVLMGEVHDNAEHHWLRGQLLLSLHGTVSAKADSSIRPGLVFEHFRAEQQSLLDASKGLTPGEFFERVAWGQSGWPAAPLFEPLFSAVLNSGFPMTYGEPSRQSVRKLAREGLSALSEQERRLWALDQPLPEQQQVALLAELEASHCGVMPASAFGNMAQAQRYRDGHLAQQVLKARQLNGSAILFAGNGHVRADRGVPAVLRKLSSEAFPILVISFVEASADDQARPDRREAFASYPGDIIVVAPAMAREDPCIAMRPARPAAP